MKLSATLKNNRGGSKVTADDTRILVELRWGNTIIGTIGLYTIKDNKVEGYRVIWQNERYSSSDKPLREFIREKGKQQTDTIARQLKDDREYDTFNQGNQ